MTTVVLAACGGDDEGIATLSSSLVDAIRTGDDVGYVRQHVQPGDMSPSGGYWLATKAGGTRPDEAWNASVRRSFEELIERLRREGVKVDALELVKVEKVDQYEVDGDADRRNISNLTLRVRDGQGEYLLKFAEGMLSNRGWVIVGETPPEISRP